MKQLITITVFVLASTIGFAQYTYVKYNSFGKISEQGLYNADPGITANDSKEIIAQKMAVVHKIDKWQYWFDNGTMLSEEYYTNAGSPMGIWKTWHDNGQLASQINYTTGDAVYCYANGVKAEAGKINIYNERIGDWNGWYENGKKNYTGSWTATGQKNGLWQYYDNTEQIVASEFWTNGVKVK